MKSEAFDFSLSLGRTAGQKSVLAPANHLAYLKYMGKTRRSFSDQMQIYLDQLAFEHSEKIFPCSEMVKQELIECDKVEESKLEVLYPPFNTSKFTPHLKKEKTRLRKENGIGENQKVFIFVSTGHKRKGLDFLLKLFSLLDSKQYMLLVSGKPEVKTELKNIKNIGFNSHLNEWYALSDYLIHPAKYEPYGQIITEAIYMKTPVLISDNVGAKELVTNKEGKVLPEGDLDIWLQTILSVQLSDFSFDEDFVTKNQLSLEAHMTKMLSKM